MTHVRAEGLEIKNVLIGLQKYQIKALDELACKHRRSRSDLIREAIDLFLRGVELKEEKDESTTDE